ncbi:MAG: aromatic ring-hydroxylating dioxygenase subunit alpha [Pseudomonadota bacterium]
MASINELIAKRKPGFGLEQAFYRRDDIYAKEVSRIVLQSWLYVGHQSQVAAVGDFFTTELAGESVIIVRSGDSEIEALINVCRHRGSRVCLEDDGNARLFSCPYHAWSYNLDGSLRGAPQMANDIQFEDFGLKQAKLVNFHGLLFINFDTDANFDVIAADLDEPMQCYGLANAKVAHRQNYPMTANWKLAIENFCECYHCAPAHREFAVAHSAARPDSRFDARRDAVLANATACGLSTNMCSTSFDSPDYVGSERYIDRYALLKGHVTGSRDGGPVAPLMGSISDYDGGATDIQIGPLSYGLAYCDHVVLYRFMPTSINTTDCEVIWLVNESAVEGEDYSLEELVWLWDVTTKADKKIIEDNRRGVDSHFFEPGPFAPMEMYTEQFTEWYLNVMRSA